MSIIGWTAIIVYIGTILWVVTSVLLNIFPPKQNIVVTRSRPNTGIYRTNELIAISIDNQELILNLTSAKALTEDLSIITKDC